MDRSLVPGVSGVCVAVEGSVGRDPWVDGSAVSRPCLRQRHDILFQFCRVLPSEGTGYRVGRSSLLFLTAACEPAII